MRAVNFTVFLVVLLAVADVAQAQPASPPGDAATQIGDTWITVKYSRPILRGRTNIFGEGESYGTAIYSGAPVWRAGANVSTRLKTTADLKFGDHTLPVGEYSVFVELKAAGWTLIFSNHTAKNNFSDAGDGLWGAYNYTTDQDVFRVSMTVEQIDSSLDQFTILFIDVTDSGGTLAMVWEDTMASAPFTLAE